jgi:hypothetical protein
MGRPAAFLRIPRKPITQSAAMPIRQSAPCRSLPERSDAQLFFPNRLIGMGQVSPPFLAHGLTVQGNAYGLVHQTIEDGVGHGGIRE